jgi:hypothetical protein
MKIIIAIPAFNEAPLLASSVTAIVEYCQRVVSD